MTLPGLALPFHIYFISETSFEEFISFIEQKLDIVLDETILGL
jgi:hypothetical protein